MKKKCTNSACRRMFTPWQEGGIVKCPHCGKVYPRLKPSQTAIPTLLLLDWKPGCSKSAGTRALRDLLKLNARDTILTLREMKDAPIAIRELPPDRARHLQAEMETLGFITRLDWNTPGTLPDSRKEHRYMVMLEKFPAGNDDIARMFLRSRGHWNARAELKNLRHQRVIISRNVTMEVARNIAAAAEQSGLSVKILRDRPGEKGIR